MGTAKMHPGSEEFKAGLKKIDVSEIGKRIYVLHADGIANKLASSVVNENFGSGAKLKTITEALQKLEEIENKIEKTNYFYTQDDETKKQLMAQIQEKMNELKKIKTSLETDPIEEAAETYNENMYKAMVDDFKNKVEETANRYNNSSYRYPTKSIPDNISLRTLIPWEITENGPVKRDGQIYTEGYTEYDNIHLSRGKASQMLKEIQKRNLWKDAKVPYRPDASKTSKYKGDVDL